MKIILTESQFKKVISEAKFAPRDLCNSFSYLSPFCKKVENILKDGKTGGRGNNMVNLSKEFFNKVIKNEGYFKTVTLTPPHPEFRERIEQLEHLNTILRRYNSCPEIIKAIEKDIKVLPEKKLKMVVDDQGQYSLLNRLDTHYSAKAYLMTTLISTHVDIPNKELNLLSNDDIREILKDVLTDTHVEKVSQILNHLILTDPKFKDYLFSALNYSRDSGNKVESQVITKLKEKFGANNVIEFAGDYDFVDYFGIDAILIHNGHAHPIQISSSAKNPKIFNFYSEGCQPIGFYLQGKRIMRYQPEL